MPQEATQQAVATTTPNNIFSSLSTLQVLPTLTIINNMKGGADCEQDKAKEKTLIVDAKKEQDEEKEDVKEIEEKEAEKEIEEKEAEKETKEKEQEEEKGEEAEGEETTDVTFPEQVVVQTLVTLPHTSPSVTPTWKRMPTLAYMMSISSQGGGEDILEDVDLDEVISIPKFDLETLTLEQIQILQATLKRKKWQEQLRQEHKQR